MNTWGVSDKPRVCDGSLHNTNHQFQAKLLASHNTEKCKHLWVRNGWCFYWSKGKKLQQEHYPNLKTEPKLQFCKSYPLQGISFVIVFLFVNEQSIKNQWHVSTQWCPGADPGFCERVVWFSKSFGIFLLSKRKGSSRTPWICRRYQWAFNEAKILSRGWLLMLHGHCCYWSSN